MKVLRRGISGTKSGFLSLNVQQEMHGLGHRSTEDLASKTSTVASSDFNSKADWLCILVAGKYPDSFLYA
jgi:hypothetical protein